MFELNICNLDQAQILCRHWATRTISLLDTATDRKKLGFQNAPNHLVLFFDDVPKKMFKFVPPERAHLLKILEFTETLTDADRLLVHCHAGIGRSTATAMAILMQHGMQFEKAFRRVESIRPILYPNSRIVEMVDRHFALDGAFVQFVQAWKESGRDAMHPLTSQERRSV